MANPHPRPHRRKPRELPEGFISLTAAGAQIGLGRTAARSAYKRGEIPGSEFSGMIIVRSDWLQRRMEQADAEAEERRRRYTERSLPRRARGRPPNTGTCAAEGS